jgi:hypothetical protein
MNNCQLLMMAPPLLTTWRSLQTLLLLPIQVKIEYWLLRTPVDVLFAHSMLITWAGLPDLNLFVLEMNVRRTGHQSQCPIQLGWMRNEGATPC